MLTADAILHAPDIVYEVVQVPEWGDTVRVRGLLAGERDELEDWMVGRGHDGTEYRARLLVYGCVDEDGKRLFGPEHVATLAMKSAAAVERVVAVIGRLSGLTRESREELGKGSAAAGGASSSASQPSSAEPSPSSSTG